MKVLRRIVPLAAVASLSLGMAPSAPAAVGTSPSRPTPDIVISGIFDRPESVLHDTRRDVYLVSNITNGPRDTDNTGFISRVAPDGQVLAARWIAGGVRGVTLNAPKGMAIARGLLYVADIDQLRIFDAATGAPRGSIAFPNATFLNDVASDEHGTVYVTDIGFTTVPAFGPSGTDAVYRVSPRGAVSVVAAGNAVLHHPNGVTVRPDGRLLVVTYDPFDGTREMFTLDAAGRKSNVITLPTGLLDGVEITPRGVLVSSWVDFSNATAAVIYLVRRDGSIVQVAGGFQNAADIGYDLRRNRILIPALPDPGTGGRVVIRSLGR
ncbi:MAG: SMP-30/gluconolactonase/LRE family protein [Kineosporiaceae bacterium]|nr:SMP-30/gluconolactonase/LRE family protein [Kineosporiaceae bacterium]MBK8074001.1 SMP-30/gluconolactonase/LRE family protein [Kineosporiaceae bacterium]